MSSLPRPVLVAALAALSLALPVGDAAAQSPGSRQICAKNLGGFLASASITAHSGGTVRAAGESGQLALGNEWCMTVPATAPTISVTWTIVTLPAAKHCRTSAHVRESSRQVDTSVHGTVFNPHCYASER